MERKLLLKSHVVSAGKRFISLLLIGAFIVTFGNPLLTIEAQAAVITRQYGDVNWDGEVDSRDTMLILQHNASATISKIHDQHPDWILNGDDYKVADVNNDGTVDSRDVLRVQEYIAAHEQAKIRAKHPEWYTYLQRNYSYNATLTPSSTKYYLDLNGTKSCQIRLARNYGRGCYLKFVPLGSTRDSLGLKLNGWDKAGKNYYFTVTGKVTGNFSFYVNLFDSKKNQLIVSSNVITVNVKKGGSKNVYKKYALTNNQLKKIARLCQQEQGTVKGAKAEASLMANQLETSKTRQKKYGSGANGLYNWVRNGKWFARAAYWMDHGKVSPEVLAGVRDVLVNGNRVLPLYVDEHDCISDIKSISTGNPKNRKHYIRGKTIVRNKYKSKWTFWCFPDSKSDPFGYTDEAYKAASKK